MDLLFSSSSKRTRLTADFFIEAINIKKINFIDELYHSSSENIINILKKISSTKKISYGDWSQPRFDRFSK